MSTEERNDESLDAELDGDDVQQGSDVTIEADSDVADEDETGRAIDPDNGEDGDIDDDAFDLDDVDIDDLPDADDDDHDEDDDGVDADDVDASVPPVAGTWASPAGSDFDDAANALTAWSKGAGVARDSHVVALTQSLRARDGLTFWATVDLDAELPEPRGGSITLLRRIAKALIFVRNVAVFAPVGLTWLAINRVTPGFEDYVARQAATGGDANFLQYWSTAAEEAFRLPEIAYLGFLIIAGIVVATLVAGVFNGLASRRLERAMKARAELILRLRRTLHTTRQATPESLASSLAESLTELLESSRLIIDAARRLELASVGVSELEPTFRSLNDQLEVFDQRLGSAIVGSVDRLNSAVTGLSGLMEGSLKGLLTESVAGLDEVREQLHRTAASVEFGTQRLIEDLDTVSRRRNPTR